MPYSAANKQTAREYVNALRARTVCRRCGNQPIEWHHRNNDNDVHYNRSISRMASLGFPLARIEAELAKCDPLCRSCHMSDDGRAAALTETRPRRSGDIITQPKPCASCGTASKPLWQGMCRRCYDDQRRN